MGFLWVGRDEEGLIRAKAWGEGGRYSAVVYTARAVDDATQHFFLTSQDARAWAEQAFQALDAARRLGARQ